MTKNVDEFNLKIHNNLDEFITECENDYFSQLQKIADKIKENPEKTPIILLSGPSGSGKTTTALTIEHILDNSGFETHTLSLDNYFRAITGEERELLEQGKLDLESPSRVDSDLLNTQLQKMINCEAVMLPKYDFTAAMRVDSGRILARKHNEPVILEGIHSLNPDVIQIPDENTLKIYVSVRTRVQHNDKTVHPSYIRLLRRMMRDKLFRGRSIAETIKMYESVEIGEKNFIMPYKYRSDFDVDTFIPYELSVYKPVLLEQLKTCQNCVIDENIQEVMNILEVLKEIHEEKVPKTSLIHEFIGNGHFEY